MALAVALSASGLAQELLLSTRVVGAQAHQALIETVRQSIDSAGQTVLHTNRYTELATGLHRHDLDTGDWIRASERIESFDRGFVARQSAHQVLWPRLLDEEALVDVLDGEGRRYRSRVLGLSWFDAASGQSAVIAGSRPSEGQLLGPNRVVFRDAFVGVAADLVYVNRLDGVAQEVVLRAALPGPETWGLDPASTRLEVITEFVEAPAFQVRAQVLRSMAPAQERATWVEPDLVDETVEFGAYRLGPGRAFALGAEADWVGSVEVAKRWAEVGGRRVLFEQVEWERVRAAVEGLPRQAAMGEGDEAGVSRTASVQRRLPERPRVAAARSFGERFQEYAVVEGEPVPIGEGEGWQREDGSVEVALVPAGPPGLDWAEWTGRPGFVLDYELVTSQADYTFKGNMTYYVSGAVSLSGTTTLEGGTVIKFAQAGTTPRLQVGGPLVCRTSLYRPAIFTAKDDNTVGEIISGSSGNPSGSYAYLGLYCFNTATDIRVEHVRVKYAVYGLAFAYNTSNSVRHAQLLNCTYPIYTYSAGTMPVHNVLIAHVQGGAGAAIRGYYTSFLGEHLTVHNAPNLFSNAADASLSLKNSLLVAVAEIQDYTGRGDQAYGNAEEASADGVFQTVGGGAHYLDAAANNPHRDAGTVQIDAGLLAELATLTTHPPVEHSTPITSDTTWGPANNIRDIDFPDRGYHYPALDYLVSNVSVAARLTLTNGVAVAVAGTTGLALANGGALESQGSPLGLNRLVESVLVLEGAASSGNQAALIREELGSGSVGEVRLRFNELAMPAGGGAFFQGGLRTLSLTVRDNEFYGGSVTCSGAWDGQSRTVNLHNNLWARVNLSLGSGFDTNLTAHARNNTFWRCTVSPSRPAAAPAWEWRDNVFEECGLWLYHAPVLNSHNAYVGNGAGGSWPLPDSDGDDVYLASLNYLTDAWGRRWYPDTGQFTEAGSRTAEAADLYFYTIDVQQAPEGQSEVDLGYHYRSIVRPLPVQLNDPFGLVNAPVSIDYHPIEDALIVSVNFPFGTPYNFVRIDEAGNVSTWSDAAGHGWQIAHIVVPSSECIFVQGEMFYGANDDRTLPRVYHIPNGQNTSTLWLTIDEPIDGLWPMGFTVDATGYYQHNLLLTTAYGDHINNSAVGGRVLRVNRVPQVVEIADVGYYMQGLIVVPDDPQRYGDEWAGCILTRGQIGEYQVEWESGLLRIAPGGATSVHLAGEVNPLAFALIVPGADLYVAQPGTPADAAISKIPASYFVNLGGDMVLMQSGEMQRPDGLRESAELFVLRWQPNGASAELVLAQITHHPADYMDDICFAPIVLGTLME